jgi:hypothetical protein
LIDKFPNHSITYDQLLDFDIIFNEPFILTVEWSNVKYEFLLRVKENNSKLLVFGSGAYNPAKMKPPIFQRHSWVDHFENSIIFYNDPTLYLGDFGIGWGHGTSDRFYLKDIASIISVIMKKVYKQPEQTLFYGSSAGGFMSLMLAGLIQGSTALVNNPQTVITNYYEKHVSNLFKYAHPNLTWDEVVNTYQDRLDVIKFYQKNKFVPNIYFLQNISCKHDVNNHLIPFVNGLKDINEDTLFKKVNLEFYFDGKSGHNPLDLEKSLYYLYRLGK